MSSIGFFPSATESLQHLEDFSTYTSCIRCFGKPIISPLLTAEQREEACRFRAAAAKIVADNVKKNECSSLSDKVKDVYRRVEEHLASCNNSDFVSYSDLENQENSALHATGVIDFQTCPTNGATTFSNEMHMSTCKIPSSDICSTVHKDVIVFPNIIQNNNDKEDLPKRDTVCPTSNTDQSKAHLALDCAEYSSFQDSNQHGLPVRDSAMPYESALTEQIYSVSDDEHDSITESTEFGSLPTVINARQFVPQDTDNDSNATCLSQSTDLEKYFDNSIEYSSPEDGLSQSQISNRLNTSRSEDASSETLVNTGSESTPCASAMAMLSYADSDIVGKKAPSATLANSSVEPQRAHSVDSYMKMAKACAKGLPFRKSQSEPSNSESKQYSDVNSSSNPPDLTLEDSKPKVEVEDSQQESTLVSDSEVCVSFEPQMEVVKKSLKRKHVRTNSYTLEHPSPALIMAHADCNCTGDSPNLSPHSCSSDKVIHSPPNLAFKKEKVNIVLPPMLERDKYFPILSSTSISMNKTGTNTIEDSKLSMSDEADVLLPAAAIVNLNEIETISTSVENLNKDTEQVHNNLTEYSSRETFEESNEMNNLHEVVQEVNQQNEQITMSSMKPSEMKSNDIKVLLNQVIRDVKETQKNRVNQFFEEQNKLWFQMQEEFKEQERLLCEKLNSVFLSPFTDGALPMPYVFSDVDKKQSSAIEKNMPNTNTNTLPLLNRNSGDDSLSVKNSDKDSSEFYASETSHYPRSLSDTTSTSNFTVTEFPNENIHSSQSTTSPTNTKEEFEKSPPLPDRSSSLSASNGSLQNDSFDGNPAGSYSLRSSASPKSFKTSDRRFQNHTLDILNDRPESIPSSFSVRSDTSVDDNFKASEVSVGSSIERGIPMQSLYNNCPIPVLSVNNCLENNCSSTSLRSSSDLSQTSDMNKVFCDSRFLKENNCRACSSVSPGNVCADQQHGESGSICPDCHSGMKCHSFERLHFAYENISDDGNRHFTTPISPAEFIPHPSLFNQEINSTSITMNSLQFQNPLVTAASLSFKNNNSWPLGINSSETPNSDVAENYPLLNNNLQPNMKQNTLIINAKNDLSDMNTQDDKSYSEDEIRAINDLVQSSYTSSYSSQLNADYCRALVTSNNSNEKQGHVRSSQSAYHIPFNDIPSVEKGALKQSISTSLTNLKRRQSRDIVKDPILMKKFEKLPALVKGYLTRRLFKTERVQDLIRTLKDTALLVGKFSQELNLKGNSVSENEVDFHRQLIAQLMKTFESVYDIFCTMSIREQMKIISESRNFRIKKKVTEKKESSASSFAEKCRSSPSKKPKLTAATLKALERKRSSINSRTYTVEDFKGCKPRVNSTTTTKSRTVSPYKATLGTSMKRKTTSVCKTSPWK